MFQVYITTGLSAMDEAAEKVVRELHAALHDSSAYREYWAIDAYFLSRSFASPSGNSTGYSDEDRGWEKEEEAMKEAAMAHYTAEKSSRHLISISAWKQVAKGKWTREGAEEEEEEEEDNSALPEPPPPFSQRPDATILPHHFPSLRRFRARH